MLFDELFEQRGLVALRLKDCIRDRGYTKISFAKKTEISRPALDKLLSCSVNNKSTFDKYLQKILTILEVSVDELLCYKGVPKGIDAVYSQNAPDDYQMTEKAQKQYELMMDILDLCEIYY